MNKALIKAAAALSLGIGTANSAMADDPCAGHGVACWGDDCMVCWKTDNGGVACTAASFVEVSMSLPGCVEDTRDPGLDIPDGLRLPELTGTGGRTVLPLPPQTPDPQTQRDPIPTTAGQ